MPTINDHISQAQHNERFVGSFDITTTQFKDWILTVFFYSAIHYIEAFLATKNIHPKIHSQRDTHVGIHLQGIYHEYRDLKQLSEDARYYCKVFSASDTCSSKTKLDNIKIHLKNILPQIV